MTKYDTDKVRAVCLELMGWTLTYNHVTRVEDWRHDNRERKDYDELDPTTSLDDALPLLDKYGIVLFPPSLNMESTWIGKDQIGTEGESETAPLAVCLCALRCVGRNLKDFETT